jgi:BlaI family transcriptional regulator, penicillinase repressor
VCNATMRNTSIRDQQAGLARLERQVMLIVWKLGHATAEAVRAELRRPLKDSTVRTVLRRLEQKGYLAHAVENRTYVYRAAEARQQVTAKAVKRIVDWFCNGSVEELLVCMVDSTVLDRKVLLEFAVRIAKKRKEAT